MRNTVVISNAVVYVRIQGFVPAFLKLAPYTTISLILTVQGPSTPCCLRVYMTSEPALSRSLFQEKLSQKLLGKSAM